MRCAALTWSTRSFVDHIVLIVPAGHAWASRDAIDPSELLEQPFLIRESTSGTRRVMLAELGKHDITLDDMRLFVELGSAVEVPVAGFDLHRQIYMVQKIIREANRAIEVFWEFVHDPSNADLLCLAG